MALGLALGAASLGGTLFKGIIGNKQRKEAQRELDELEGQEPDIYVPKALRSVAREPIAEEFMEVSEDNAARRTGGSLRALKSAGARGILGGVESVMEGERQQEARRVGDYEQQRKAAMTNLANAETDVQRRKLRNYLSKLTAAQRAKMAGQQNIASALGDVSGLAGSLLGAKLREGGGEGGQSTGTRKKESIVNLPSKGTGVGGINPNQPFKNTNNRIDFDPEILDILKHL